MFAGVRARVRFNLFSSKIGRRHVEQQFDWRGGDLADAAREQVVALGGCASSCSCNSCSSSAASTSGTALGVKMRLLLPQTSQLNRCRSICEMLRRSLTLKIMIEVQSLNFFVAKQLFVITILCSALQSP